MSFLTKVKHCKYRKFFLKFLQIQDKFLKPQNSLKRISTSISDKSIKEEIARASVVVEAAVVLPIFLFAMMQLLSFLDVLRLQTNIEAQIHQNARQMAVYAHAGSAGPTFSKLYVKGNVIASLGTDYLNNAPLAGGAAGISFATSKIMEKECIDLIALYRIEPYFSAANFQKFQSFSRCKIRAFTGYDTIHGNIYEASEQLVYVTERGRAYHTDRNCPHISVSVQAMKLSELSGKRNYDGGKYYSCSSCKKKGSVGDIVYVTNYGTLYHSRITCSKLKRSVKVIPISQVDGRKACGRCG